MKKEEILEKMNKYWDTHEATFVEDDVLYFEEDTDEYNELYNILFDELTPNGHWNNELKRFLQENGYECYIGDGDSFGILIACVSKDSKVFTIG